MFDTLCESVNLVCRLCKEDRPAGMDKNNLGKRTITPSRGERVSLVGFGTFQTVQRKAKDRQESSDRREDADPRQESP